LQWSPDERRLAKISVRKSSATPAKVEWKKEQEEGKEHLSALIFTHSELGKGPATGHGLQWSPDERRLAKISVRKSSATPAKVEWKKEQEEGRNTYLRSSSLIRSWAKRCSFAPIMRKAGWGRALQQVLR
jgi:hypothetical protein